MMNTTLVPNDTIIRDGAPAFLSDSPVEGVADLLCRWLGTPMSIFDSESESFLMEATDQPFHDWELLAALAQRVAHDGKPTAVAEDGPLMTYAIPIEKAREGSLVAVATFLMDDVESITDWSAAASLLGVELEAAEEWARHQRPTSHKSLYQLGNLVSEYFAATKLAQDLLAENRRLRSERCLPEKSLRALDGVVAALQASNGDDVFYERTLQSLAALLRADGLALVRHNGLTNNNDEDNDARDPRRTQTTSPIWHQWGNCPVDARWFTEVVKPYEDSPPRQPIVLDGDAVESITPLMGPQEQILLVPIRDDQAVVAWLLVVTPVDADEVCRIDHRLFDTLARLLALHDACFADVYWNSEAVTGLVHSLTSAIDAKDPYTRGHSDRVARIALRLGQELGFDTSTLKTLYLSGLLHDIGKIGIDDAILLKPGNLTKEEYEHIKSHTVIGYNIISGLKSLKDMLPAVRHHHESWDGKGYPDGLAGEEIPLVARVVAVADSYDAMSSTRPYRDPLTEKRLFEFLRRGAGKQWDAQIIDAFFAAVDDVRVIVAGAEANGLAPPRPTQMPAEEVLLSDQA